MTISTTLTALASAAERHLLPAPRGAAVAATLRELSGEPGLADLVVSEAALRAAFVSLSTPMPSDDGPTTSRRATCRDLAALLGAPEPVPDGTSTGQLLVTDALLAEALPLWSAWAEIAAPSSDPRRLTMRTTYRREHAELLASCERSFASPEEVATWAARAAALIGPSTDVHVETVDLISSRYVRNTLRETYSDGVARVARVLTSRGTYRFPRPVLVAAGLGMSDQRGPLHYHVLVAALRSAGLRTNDRIEADDAG